MYVDQPSEAATLEILQGLRERYERHHKCAYTEEALEAAVALAVKYIPDRQLPDKAIDVLDEAGSRARIAAFTARRDMRQAENPKVREYMQVSGLLGGVSHTLCRTHIHCHTMLAHS